MGRLTRRQFVHVSAATLAAAAAPRSAFARRSPNETLRIGVIGVRGRGRNHIDAFRTLPNVSVAAVCDADQAFLDREKAAFAERGERVALFQDIRELLDKGEIDAVSIATPNHWHSLATIWACQAGKDVYCEKPVSHNVWEGTQMVAAARKYDRIVATGTQSRSSRAITDAIAWVRAGNLGSIELARGLCYKPRRSIGKVTEPQAVPESVDYDLWCGPAPKVPLGRKNLHYDWHWVFATGNGDLGNQGIHQMDICRWALGESGMPKSVMSVGGRIGYDDDGNTPNTMFTWFEYDSAPLVFEVRGLPRDRAAQEKWGGAEMDAYLGQRIGVVIHCAQGTLRISSNYGVARAYSNDGEVVKEWKGGGNHFENFVGAVRSRKVGDLKSDIQEGHISSALCHLGNVSYSMGEEKAPREIQAAIAGNDHALETFERMATHAGANGVDLEKERLRLGPNIGVGARGDTLSLAEAVPMLTRVYREGFAVPAEV